MSDALRVTRVWASDDPQGLESATLTLERGSLSASGSAIRLGPLPYRLTYELTTTEDYVTARLRVWVEGNGWGRDLDLVRTTTGQWSSRTGSWGSVDLPPPGGTPELTAVLDCDLGLSPVTNSMPVLRHRLHERGGPVEVVTAWVSVPDLAVRASPQRYTFLRREGDVRLVRFESLDDAFAADVAFDAAGVVLDYPGIARRVA